MFDELKNVNFKEIQIELDFTTEELSVCAIETSSDEEFKIVSV